MTSLLFMRDFDKEQMESFTSFMETLAMLTSIVYGEEAVSHKFYDLYSKDNMGHVEHTQICIEMAKEFEHLHEGTVWDGDWYDTLIEFINHKLA